MRKMPVASAETVSSLSGALPAWSPGRAGSPARPVFFAQTTRTAPYKNDNDDASFVERLADGTVLAGLFDGVTIPKRSYRTGHMVSAFVRDRLKVRLAPRDDGRRPIVETELASAIQDSVAVLEKTGGGAATTATVVAAVPMSTGSWRTYVINAGNSRATLFLPDGTLQPLTRLKPPGTPFAAVNTLSHGYLYKLELSKVTLPAGSIVLLTSDGIHDHVPDDTLWAVLGRAVQAVLVGGGDPSAGGLIQRLARRFTDAVVESATEAQERARLADDATALALLLDAPVATLEQKRRTPPEAQ
jgi:serine/threonine protein phosphatase PrpC